MIEDSFILDATPADLLAYIQRRLLHLDEVNERLDQTLKDIIRASERAMELSAAGLRTPNSNVRPSSEAA